MSIPCTQLKPNSYPGGGRVRRFELPHGGARVTQITTFCPDGIGPGAAHLYLIEDEALILVDTGIPTDLAKAMFYAMRIQAMPPEIAALPSDLSERQRADGLALAGRRLEDIDLLAITHGHMDHYSMGRSVVEASGARVMAHLLDTPMICNPWGFLSMIASRRHRAEAVGMPRPPDGGPKDLGRHFDPGSLGLSLEINQVVYEDGPLFIGDACYDGIEVIHIPGHSPGSLGLLVGRPGSPRILICGDVLLYPITPHPDDLLVYLRTLDRLEAIEDVALVLPAHGRIFHDLDKRVGQIKKHHRSRLKMTFDACREPRSVWDVATLKGYFDVEVVPDRFNPMAANEALVHMELLQMAGGLSREDIRAGVHYFRSSDDPFDQVYGRVLDVVGDPVIEPIMRY
ncbi:MAG: MBL fold metallo-hydrolase [Proteobacteria bacterium]|nr:MBL fold metallo-hydrolase [Pseudomonadota bacterium]